MAKKEEIEAKEETKVEAKVLSPREIAWEAHLAAYEKKNPKKFAEKKARGEYNQIPAHF